MADHYITIKQLEDFGMKKPEGDIAPLVFPMEKEISGGLKIVLSALNNRVELALMTPDGDLAHLNGVESVDDLERLEKMITGFDPHY